MHNLKRERQVKGGIGCDNVVNCSSSKRSLCSPSLSIKRKSLCYSLLSQNARMECHDNEFDTYDFGNQSNAAATITSNEMMDADDNGF